MSLIRSKPRYVIIHDMSCVFSGIDQLKIDTKFSETKIARDYNWILNGQVDNNYHFIVERINTDYETLFGRPLNRMCIYDDIPDNINKRGIHVALAGKYNLVKPTLRFYQQMAYRCIAPLIYMFAIPMTNIYLHSEITTTDNLVCPGPFFRKNVFLGQLKTMRVR